MKKLKKILIVFRKRPPLLQYIEAAFKRLGIAVETVDGEQNNYFDRYIIHSINKCMHNFRILPKDQALFFNHPLAHRNYRHHNLVSTYHQFKPDLVLIIRGGPIWRDVLEKIKKTSLLFCWWIEREDGLEEIFKEIDLFDWYFIISSSSCVEIKKQKGLTNIGLLQHAVDPEVFHPIKDIKKKK
ncbi:MAG: hypothetical protein V1872_01030 [bacterium]